MKHKAPTWHSQSHKSSFLVTTDRSYSLNPKEVAAALAAIIWRTFLQYKKLPSKELRTKRRC